ncbi:phosphoserine aminotransferase [Candidatus Pelagibacter sp. IMCC9063]|jgi:phosphoserine aminotransferase|uniref:phosphoserine transaminase n=1 Tax=Pelagibacter sp. (strain IMCC9063) TaxID=1002672 RepID=UPI000204662B|nr:phosphoserine transaminase [Candidatus Pelagibacter sp. IMCC9063]AEA81321.1 phosphoserine aminotransferase [Candidatus Pelagibacter sp. IMCC9063]
MIDKPITKPNNPNFSSGPCAKRPGWDIQNLKTNSLGRSHRAKLPKQRLAEVISLSKEILNLPRDYKVGIVAGSDTGAIESAMWSLLGKTGVETLVWESFGNDWAKDIKEQLKIKNLSIHKAAYGELPDFQKINFDNDIVFNWNGTTSGVCLPNGDWIPDNRKGLTICDATSAVFAMDMDWHKLDVITWSWQKVLGGEAAHGMIALSPKALERLSEYQPTWPIPKIFRLANNMKVIEGIFKGETVNTPSMLCVEDAIDALNWIQSIGGSKGSIDKSQSNLQVVKTWVESKDWIDFLAKDSSTLSSTSICLKITDSWFLELPEDQQQLKIKEINSLLDKEQVAFDINAYRTAPPGFRIWGGATVESSDIETLLPWIEWGYQSIKE